MRVTDGASRGPIWAEFTRVQNGQAIDNLARAFHLPRPKAKAAIIEMFAAITCLLDDQTLSRGALARLIELLSKNNYEQVLEDATLMGSTSTQVIGNEALTAIVGHSESIHIADRAAATAEITPMIAEYLLPVVAAMFTGALSLRTRQGLMALARNENLATITYSPTETNTSSAQLPVGRGSSGVFSGSTVITPELGPQRDTLYLELAERIRKAGANDPLGAVRRVVADGLGVRTRHAPWLARMHKSASALLHSASRQVQGRLRSPRSR